MERDTKSTILLSKEETSFPTKELRENLLKVLVYDSPQTERAACVVMQLTFTLGGQTTRSTPNVITELERILQNPGIEPCLVPHLQHLQKVVALLRMMCSPDFQVLFSSGESQPQELQQSLSALPIEPQSKRARHSAAASESTEQQSVPLRWNKDSILSLVKGTAVYIDRIAFAAERQKSEVTSTMEESFLTLKTDINRMLDEKLSELKAEAEKNLDDSLGKLKVLNTDFSGKQKLLLPHQRIRSIVNLLFCSSISLVRGTDILDLPTAILSAIIRYLPVKTLLSLRAVCFDFWRAVEEALPSFRDRTITIQHLENNTRTTFSDPFMTFQIDTENTGSEVVTVVHVAKRKLWGHDKTMDTRLLDEKNELMCSCHASLDIQKLKALSKHGGRTVLHIPPVVAPKSLHLEICLKNCYKESDRLKPIRSSE
ncbi:hypothetical protein Pelo_16814 [Pelomyxa schiedti]|nr:hypothetical protein Pelo_16814 [Pelomyxa schiedti]